MKQKVLKPFGKHFWIIFFVFITVHFIVAVLWDFFIEHLKFAEIDYQDVITRGIVIGFIVLLIISYQSKMKPIRREDIDLPK